MQLHEAQAIIETDDNTIPKNGGIETYVKLLKEAANLAGLKWVSKDLEGYLRDAGFVDVRAVIKKMPIGPWPKEPKMKVCLCEAQCGTFRQQDDGMCDSSRADGEPRGLAAGAWQLSALA